MCMLRHWYRIEHGPKQKQQCESPPRIAPAKPNDTPQPRTRYATAWHSTAYRARFVGQTVCPLVILVMITMVMITVPKRMPLSTLGGGRGGEGGGRGGRGGGGFRPGSPLTEGLVTPLCVTHSTATPIARVRTGPTPHVLSITTCHQ
jgi:hypothetical protein